MRTSLHPMMSGREVASQADGPFEEVDVEAPKAPIKEAFATTVIRLRIPAKLGEGALKDYVSGIGRALRTFEGFRSRKIIEVPCHEESQGRLLVIILKFHGCSPEEAFAFMTRWNESDELRTWQHLGMSIGIQVIERQVTTASLGHVDLGSGGKVEHNLDEEQPSRPPPKWKMSILIEVWVFLSVLIHGAAGTGQAVAVATRNAPFTLLVVLGLVVPMMSYAALPLTLSIGIIARWAQRRSKKPGDFMVILEDGFMLFTPDDTAGEMRKLQLRVESMERKLEAHQRARNQQPSDLDSVRRANWVDLGEEEDDVDNDDESGVTVAAKHRVRWDSVDAFNAWCSNMESTMRRFDGFLGSDLFRVDKSKLEYVALFRFTTLEKLELWLQSDDRAVMLTKLSPLVDASSVYTALGTSLRLVAAPTARSEQDQRNLLGALLFSEDAAMSTQDRVSAPVYKVTILTTLGLFLVAWPISAHLDSSLERALGSPLLEIFIATCITVIANTYLGAPFMLFLFGTWLRKLPPHPTASDPPALSNVKKFFVVGPKTNSTRLAILFFYFAALVIAAVLA